MKEWLLLVFVLFFSLPILAKQTQIREEYGFYWIDVELSSLPKSYEKNVAISKAKSLLAKHLNYSESKIELEYKDFIEIKKKRNAKVAIYTFKLHKQNVHISGNVNNDEISIN